MYLTGKIAIETAKYWVKTHKAIMKVKVKLRFSAPSAGIAEIE